MHRQPHLLVKRTSRTFSTRRSTIPSTALAIFPTTTTHVRHPQYASPSSQRSPVRAFHSSRDFADYMKQVMSPMTGRVGEQSPSEESNTLREIDRLFTIISSESPFCYINRRLDASNVPEQTCSLVLPQEMLARRARQLTLSSCLDEDLVSG